MILGLVQYDPDWEDKERNKQKLDWLLENNFKESEVLIFPEMTLTGFTMNSSEFGEPLEGKSFVFFQTLAQKYKCDIIAGIIESEKNKHFNTLIHLDAKGKLVNKYRKIHPFSYSTEDKNYTRGEKTVITKIREFNAGLSICYDLRFPELFRNYGKERAELIINIANWPVTRIEHWKALLRARAIENQCYVAGVNRVGDDPKLHYNGFCTVVDPMGNEIVTGYDEEKIIVAEISKENVSDIRKELPFLDDIHLI
ncbi:MAG TPA: nitrilase-related carbon-nitrogen hydrolase [Ignavibacteriaceae bacterium]|nr:nitrilase-related carbon-nitrogen hydrolase [Ignavibacteriaceae bacterium]